MLYSDREGNRFIVNQNRGFFDCKFCNIFSDDLKIENQNSKIVLGMSEVLIPHHQKIGYYFSSPTLIHHYITAHHYLPPKEFIDSIAALNFKIKFNGTTIFKKLVEKREGLYIH